MLTVSEIADFLEQFAPTRLAAEWDNVGLLVGNGQQEVRRIMTCLTITRDTATEAIEERADLIVSHHPMPFRPLRRLTADTVEGRLLLDLIAARVAVYSPHTAFDSTGRGINQQLAEGLELQSIAPLTEDVNDTTTGTGRWGKLSKPTPLSDLAQRVGQFLSISSTQIVGDPSRLVKLIAVGCGSAGELLTKARDKGCDCFVTGETRFHTCLEAEATDIAVVLAGHFASERFAVEQLAKVLGAQFPKATVWASRREGDPLQTVQTTCPKT